MFRFEILKARRGSKFGLILGTLGRQGSLSIYNKLKQLLKKHNKTYLQFLMAEINPSKLDLMKDIDVRSIKTFLVYYIY